MSGNKFLVLALVGGLIYFMLAYHVFFFGGTDVVVKKKLKMGFDNTFKSVYSSDDIRFKGLERVLNQGLIDVGYDQMLLERELITEDQLKKALDKLYYGE